MTHQDSTSQTYEPMECDGASLCLGPAPLLPWQYCRSLESVDFKPKWREVYAKEIAEILAHKK